MVRKTPGIMHGGSNVEPNTLQKHNQEIYDMFQNFENSENEGDRKYAKPFSVLKELEENQQQFFITLSQHESIDSNAMNFAVDNELTKGEMINMYNDYNDMLNKGINLDAAQSNVIEKMINQEYLEPIQNNNVAGKRRKLPNKKVNKIKKDKKKSKKRGAPKSAKRSKKKVNLPSKIMTNDLKKYTQRKTKLRRTIKPKSDNN